MTRYRSKAAWATAKAAELRQEATSLLTPDPGTRGDWRVVQRRQRSASVLLQEAARFDAIARRVA